MSIARLTLLIATTCLLCSLVSSMCGAAVITVDVAGQSVKCDDEKLDAKWIKPRGEQVGLFVQNTTLEPRNFLARFTGLKDQQYDIYINSGYVGAKATRELESGLRLTVAGTIADPDMMRCLETVQPVVESEYLRLRPMKDPIPARISQTLVQAVDWVRGAIKVEKTFRSVTVMVAPEGRMLEKMSHPTWMNDLDTARAITRSCWLLQQARARMAGAITDPDLRNSAVAAMTPVDLTTSFAVKNGKPRVEVLVINNCNLPITGKITAAIPKGWKWNAKKTAFADLKSGKSFKLSFDLIPAAAGTPAPGGVKMAATIELVQGTFEAEYQIKTIARTPTPESATKPQPSTKPPSLVLPPNTIQAKPADKPQ